MRVGIVGAGLMGRLLAWRLMKMGWEVTLFDKNKISGQGSAAYAAGGMLSLIAEQETAEPLIYQLAQKSLRHWENWIPQLKQNVFFRKNGSILVAHTNDISELEYIITRLKQCTEMNTVYELNQKNLLDLEPELFFEHGYFLKEEAQIDTRSLLMSLAKDLIANNVSCYFETNIINISPKKVEVKDNIFSFDWVFDCRGMGAQETFSDLRPVRGELIYLSAPEVNLSHVIRFFHPRYRLYIIPRPNNRYLIGATEIESADDSPISVRSCLELLSAAYSLHKGFAEARIIETITALRPAFPDNLPRIYYQEGLVAINGLYRHGFLIAPALVEKVIHLITQNPSQAVVYSGLIQER